MMTFQQWLTQAIARLSQSESPRRDAEILLGHVTGRARTYILAFGETALTAAQAAELETLLSPSRPGRTGGSPGGPARILVAAAVRLSATLIPRPDTECLVEQALACLSDEPCRILDLGTGTGAIALALASERPDCRVTAVDVMPDAVALAARNVEHLAIPNVSVLQSDWFSALAGQQFDIIVSNPPYIDETDPHLAQGDVRFEPKTALVAADGGLADLAHIIREGRRYLAAGGVMLLEHGWTQGQAVRELFREAGYGNIATCRDYGDNERLTLGHYQGEV
ncbi:polypeptide chain release factor methylase [Klebsiella grimontii]|uniref:Release factor glutamine methyltransferase n=1 Tax=Klebsiella grimontii TaxID=2058152 RepID=A0A7H4P1V7_9ENTR|nr:polypeptide chain release factor methylase [Klebsiella grimontii]